MQCTLVLFSSISSVFISSSFSPKMNNGFQIAASKEDTFLQLLCNFDSSMLITLKIPSLILGGNKDKMETEEIELNCTSVQC